jgi:hypothetical protein
MSLFRAVVFVDHHNAQVLQFDADHIDERKIHEHRHLTHQHASGVRSEHEFFGLVCDAFDGVTRVLITGGHQGLADFRNFVDKHRPQTAKLIVGYEVVGHPSEKELVMIARAYFVRHDMMDNEPDPT